MLQRPRPRLSHAPVTWTLATERLGAVSLSYEDEIVVSSLAALRCWT